MCSIIGCYLKNDVASTIVQGLKRMEYRGYDSVGIATLFSDKLQIRKGVGKVNDVNEKNHLDKLIGIIGIGHTRWATHGKISEENSHPHIDNNQAVAIVHNGIIENYKELKNEFNFQHKSETDSEIIANLIGYFYSKCNDVKESIFQTVSRLKGSFAFLAIFNNGTLVGVKNHEPVIIGLTDSGCIISSDVLGFIKHTNKAIYLDDREIVIVDSNQSENIKIYNFSGEKINHNIVMLSDEVFDINKSGYPHFTIKEINEQPITINNSNLEDKIKIAGDIISEANNLYLTGSGTSFNACLIGKHLLNKEKIKCETVISSEFNFLNYEFNERSLLIAISQSGESADVIEAVLKAKSKGAKIISIINKKQSTLANISDLYLPINCGTEIGVAATKSFTSQIGILALMCSYFNKIKPNFDKISKSIEYNLKTNTSKIKTLVNQIKSINNIYILGRGINYYISLEAALKIKELGYIHAEGIAAGELKHGSLALIDENVFVVLLHPNDVTYKDMEISGKQVKCRGAKLIGISDLPNDLYDYWIELPKNSSCNEIEYIISEIIPMQLFAYFMALAKNNDPDYPRNLAKSCTVK
jgi:glucosamine--fructose-6-phosphate aminotransferase (isomerizing)